MADENKAATKTPVALSLGYEYGRPILTVSGGTAVPWSIVVGNDKGELVASYTAGAPTPTARAVGGQEATPHEFFWMVDMRR